MTYAVKLTVGRPRPFLNPEYSPWWQSLGLPVESGFSFPSGHTATAMAAATVLFLWFDKRWSGVFFLVALFTGLTRCTLLVHYPSDVLGGVVVGCPVLLPRSPPYWNQPGAPLEARANGDDVQSFPSGHTTLAFTGAAFGTYAFARSFPYSPWTVPLALSAYTLAAGTAALRVTSGSHYVSDVVAGAIISFALPTRPARRRWGCPSPRGGP